MYIIQKLSSKPLDFFYALCYNREDGILRPSFFKQKRTNVCTNKCSSNTRKANKCSHWSWSWAIRLDPLWELRDTPGCVVKQMFVSLRARDTRGRVDRELRCQVSIKKFFVKTNFCFFYFFSLPLYHKRWDLVNSFFENFYKNFS